MRRHHPAPRRALASSLLATCTLLAACTLLAGCSGTAERQQPAAKAEQTVELPGDTTGEHAVHTQALPPSEYAAQFRRTEEALAGFDWMAAEALLAAIDGPLGTDDRVYRDYLLARVDWQRGRQQQAAERLAGQPAPGTAPALATMVANFQRYMAQTRGDYMTSARLGSDMLATTVIAQEAAALKRSIWRDLERLPAARLTAAGDAENPTWQAWLDLANITASTEGTAGLREALRQWRRAHPDHPAARPLPGGLGALLDQPVADDTVALILPLSGRLAPAAEAVRDGYLAAYYAARGESGADLIVLDINAYPNATAAYRDAVQQGAKLVVGPLSKQTVTELGNSSERSVPILALNRAEQAIPTGTTALVQMSLAPEDEIETLTRMAFGRGARRALIVRPAGEWGDKMDAALQEQWRALGGDIATTATYASAEAYSDSIKSAFHLADSEQRAKDVRSMLATNIEYTARRRQDFQAIFLLASNGPEARSIKPLLAFHYAGDVPVYAMSSIYSGTPDDRDRDLNGILMADLPWLLDPSPELRGAIAAGNTGSDSFTRLNALGADAYLVQSRFSQLQAGPDALFRGATGLLSMDPQLRIQREPRPAEFDDGELEPL